MDGAAAEAGGEVKTVEITEVRIKKAVRDSDPNAKDRLLAWGSITFDNEFVVHNLKIVDSPRGLAVLMPSRRMKDGEMKDIAHPLNIATRRKIEQSMLAGYKKFLTTQNSSAGSAVPA